MAEPLNPDISTAVATKATSRRGNKRSYVACQRCHALKVKCTGGLPCNRCSKARKDSACQYPSRERRVTVSESYLHQLQRSREHVDQVTTRTDGYSLRSNVNLDTSTQNHSISSPITPSSILASAPTPLPQTLGTSSPRIQAASAPTSAPPPTLTHSNFDVCMSNVDANVESSCRESGQLFATDHGSQQQFVGASTCSAFSDRVLQCLSPDSTITPLLSDRQYVSNTTFRRQMSSVASCRFPDRIRATLLVRVAIRFIGQDYHMFMQQDFFRRLEKMYASSDGLERENDSIWVCKFFVILALGELYSTTLTAAKDSRHSTVAGTEYFLTAVGLLQDLFEEPSADQIETLLFFSFYSNALGRVKSAHMYAGIALRSSTILGLHRRNLESPRLTSIEREHRRRLWWTVYIFDRSTSSKLGQPITIQDSDIDVAMPSTDGLSLDDRKSIGSSTDHLIAYINLAQITGYIMRDIHVPSSNANGEKYVQSVRSILGKLRKWDHHVPDRLRWDPAGGVPRSVASLQLHFNHCIILTTRPILLYVFQVKNPFGGTGTGLQSSSGIDTPPISDTIRSLADSCVTAARTSNAIIVQLFVENALATGGYFDAHHLFASTIVLIISAISYPNASDSDAVQTAFQLLMMMRDNGNAIAGKYFARLLQIQESVSNLFAKATATQQASPVPNGMAAMRGGNEAERRGHDDVVSDRDHDHDQERLPSNLRSLDMPLAGVNIPAEDDWSKFIIPPTFYGNYEEYAAGDVTVDPLDNPLLQAFLDNTDDSQDGNNLMHPEHMRLVL